MGPILFESIKIGLIFILGWVPYFLFLQPRNIKYVNFPLIHILIFGSVITLSLFFIESSLLNISLLFVIALTFLVSTKFLISDKDSLLRNYLTAKYFEIIFQQVYITAVIFLLSRFMTYDVLTSGLIFSILFGLFHIPIIFFKFLKNMRFIYFVLSFLGGFVFYYLITNLIYGYFFTYLIHTAFYVIISFKIPKDVLKNL
jgi:hypothetical protein